MAPPIGANRAQDLRKLRRLAEQRDRKVDELEAKIAAEVRRLQAEGYPMRELAEVVGISRVALYGLVKRSGPEDGRPESANGRKEA